MSKKIRPLPNLLSKKGGTHHSVGLHFYRCLQATFITPFLKSHCSPWLYIICTAGKYNIGKPSFFKKAFYETEMSVIWYSVNAILIPNVSSSQRQTSLNPLEPTLLHRLNFHAVFENSNVFIHKERSAAWIARVFRGRSSGGLDPIHEEKESFLQTPRISYHYSIDLLCNLIPCRCIIRSEGGLTRSPRLSSMGFTPGVVLPGVSSTYPPIAGGVL